MSMKVDGGNNEYKPQKYTMESLNIKKGTSEASIFNEIDKFDGKEDGYLTDLQYIDYQKRVSNEKNIEEFMKPLEQDKEELEKQKKIWETKMDRKKEISRSQF